MDFREEATIQAAEKLVEAKLVMLFLEKDDEEYENYKENRKVILVAAEKTWGRVVQTWKAYETEKLEVAIMLGFHKAVESRQNWDSSDSDKECTEAVEKYVRSFQPHDLYKMDVHGTLEAM